MKTREGSKARAEVPSPRRAEAPGNLALDVAGGTSLAEDAYRLLEESIVTLALPPGAFLTERKLCEQFSLGRTPVREAIQRLAQDSLVEVVPRSGVRITPIRPDQERMVLELRDLVERLVLTRAAEHATSHERRHLLGLADKLEAAASRDDLTLFLRFDDAFNRFVAGCARHAHAARVLGPLHALARRLGCIHYARGDRRPKLQASAKAHADLIHAICAGDQARTNEALTVLLRNSEAIIDNLEAD